MSRVPLQLPLTRPRVGLRAGNWLHRVLGQFDEADIHRVRQGYLRMLWERAVDVLDAGSLIGTGHRP